MQPVGQVSHRPGLNHMVDAQHDHHANGYEDAAHDGFGPLGDGAQAIRAFSDRFAGAKADDKYQDRNAEGKEDRAFPMLAP